MFKKIKNIMSKKDEAPEKEPTQQAEEQIASAENEGQETAENTETSTKGAEKTKKSRKKKGKEAKLMEELEEAQAEMSELKDKYLRLRAEFDNFRKRSVREKIDLMGTAARDTMAALLPVLDDFDRAKKNAEDDQSTEPFSEGVMLVYNKLYNSLKQKGLEPMESTGEVFDPELHEAITEIPAPTEEMKGKIVDTIEKGYLLKDKIIRHAKVVVGK
ncbi:MAG: nucleotide exchange factor GrpE [Bacteroidota bacterium]